MQKYRFIGLLSSFANSIQDRINLTYIWLQIMLLTWQDKVPRKQIIAGVALILVVIMVVGLLPAAIANPIGLVVPVALWIAPSGGNSGK